MVTRIFKGDKWNRLLGSIIPDGEMVEVARFFPRRKVLMEYEGQPVLTMLWCLKKIAYPLEGLLAWWIRRQERGKSWR